MAEYVERVVIVVDVEWEGPWPGHLEYRRYAGKRIDDRRWQLGSSSGTLFDNRDLDAVASQCGAARGNAQTHPRPA